MRLNAQGPRAIMLALILTVLGIACLPDREKRTPMRPPDRFAALSTAAELSAFCEERLARVAALRTELLAVRGNPVAKALEPFDRIAAELDAVANAASLLRSVHPGEDVRHAAEACEQKAADAATKLSLDREVFDALFGAAGSDGTLDAAFEKLELRGADEAARQLAFRTLRDFRRAGVNRDEATRGKIRKLQEELVVVGQRFDANIRNDVRSIRVAPDRLAGLPEDWIRAHPPAADGLVTVTTDYPDYYPFMSYAKDGEARRELYIAAKNRAVPANLDVLRELLAKRHELATLLGYPDWASYVTEDKMIGSAKAAREFVEKIAKVSEKRMRADLERLLARKRKDVPDAKTVEDWERMYYEDRVQAEEYRFDAQAVRPYFEYGRVKQGLFDVTAKMFGLRYERAAAATWHADVEAWDVFEAEGGRRVGRFYLDMHPRDGKYKHAAMFPVVTGVEGVQAPEAALVCNFTRARDGAPALLEHDDVKTFFHEFGHLLHHLLGGHQRWAGLSGIRTEWDFVEAPSQMLEEWVWDAATLRTFAKHHETGEPIPEETVGRMRAASDFGKGLQVRHQMYYAALSLSLYDRDPARLDTTALSRELQNRYSPFPYVDGTYMQASFGHLDGYSAIYYTYMWSLVIAKDLFSAFQADGLLDPGVAARYRDEVLAPGGSRDAEKLVERFLGRKPSFDAYERWLDEEPRWP